MSFTARIHDIITQNHNGLLGLHHSWERVLLSEIATILNGFAFSSSSFSSKEGTPLIRIRDVMRGQTETYVGGNFDPAYLIQPGEILVGMDGDFNCAPWEGPPALLNQRVCKITPDGACYDAQFLRYILPGYLHAINAHTPSVTVKHLSSRTLEDLPLPLPPLGEQRRIAAEVDKQLSRLDAAVAALKRVQANLKRYRAAVLKAACEGKLVPQDPNDEPADRLLARILKERRERWNGRGKYKEQATPNVADLPALPQGWTWTSVESIATKVVDGVHKKPNYVKSGIPFVTVRNLTEGRGISFERLNYITEEDHREFIKRANPERGDILVSKDGTLGVVRAVRTDEVFSIFVSVAMIKPVLQEMSEYLCLALSSPQVQVQMVPKGSGLQHIHLEDLRADCVPIPPAGEQRRIVAEVERRLSAVEKTEDFVEANLHRADRLRQAILKHAFEGKLVEQDPNDEPAGALLGRIQAEREVQRTSVAGRKPGVRSKPDAGKRQVGTRSARRKSSVPR